MKGTQIINLHTLKSWYDNDSVGVETDEGFMQIKVNEIAKMVNWFKFEVDKPNGDKRRTITYLKNPEFVPDRR